jgi:hypothetical protein
MLIFVRTTPPHILAPEFLLTRNYLQPIFTVPKSALLAIHLIVITKVGRQEFSGKSERGDIKTKPMTREKRK